ncbi:MAG: serine/threonine protein kinase [Myxococcales bacterium]|nr:serine/threonine protein kinase [Myxococcales bacterium]
MPARLSLRPLPFAIVAMQANEVAPAMASDSGKSANHGRGVGDVVAGRYRITGVVGKGAMGAVYAAEHTATSQKVALKFMIVGDDEDKEFIARFEQEAKVMAGLRSTNTIRIYDFGRADDGALFMAMELLVGKPLDKHLRDLAREGHAMSEGEACRLAIQMLRSLTEAHGTGLVHRDMKPGNVFLNDDGGDDIIAKVLDFGLARVGGSALTNVGRIMGTPAYMAPEQWQGAGVGPPADLYAVGCMMYAMVTGEPPYQAGDNVLSLMHKHCTEAIPDPRAVANTKLSDGYVAVTAKAMAKNAADRYQDAKSMRQAIESVAGGSWNSTNLGISTGASATATTQIGRGEAAGSPTVAYADQQTIASDMAVAMRKSDRSVLNSGAVDATIAAPQPAHKSNLSLAQHGASDLRDDGELAKVTAPKLKTWLPIAAALGVVAIAVGIWVATRSAPTLAAPEMPTATQPTAVAAPAAVVVAPPVVATPSEAQAPVVAAPPIAPDAVVPTVATPGADGAAVKVDTAGLAKPPATKPKAARPAATKKKAAGYETVD